MNRREISWAKRHDWFLRVNDSGDGVVCRDYMPVACGMQTKKERDTLGNGLAETSVQFTDYQKLRGWAGY